MWARPDADALYRFMNMVERLTTRNYFRFSLNFSIYRYVVLLIVWHAHTGSLERIFSEFFPQWWKVIAKRRYSIQPRPNKLEKFFREISYIPGG